MRLSLWKKSTYTPACNCFQSRTKSVLPSKDSQFWQWVAIPRKVTWHIQPRMQPWTSNRWHHWHALKIKFFTSFPSSYTFSQTVDHPCLGVCPQWLCIFNKLAFFVSNNLQFIRAKLLRISRWVVATPCGLSKCKVMIIYSPKSSL